MAHSADIDAEVLPVRCTPLYRACARRKYGVAAALVRRGADPNGGPGHTVLIHASDFPIELVRLLMYAGADPNRSSVGWTPLRAAAYHGAAEVVAELLRRGADVNGRSGGAERTALSDAAVRGHGDVLRILVDAGADTSAGANPVYTDWKFVAAAALEWRRKYGVAALDSERAAHRATEEGFRFALPHLLAAAAGGGNKRPRRA